MEKYKLTVIFPTNDQWFPLNVELGTINRAELITIKSLTCGMMHIEIAYMRKYQGQWDG